MNDSQDMEILEALVELKNQIQDLRKVFADSVENDDGVIDDTNTVNSDEYNMELTPQEMKALLFTPPVDKLPNHGPVSEPDYRDETSHLRKQNTKFREQTERELNDLKKSVSVLSEMFGRHELEIQKLKKF